MFLVFYFIQRGSGSDFPQLKKLRVALRWQMAVRGRDGTFQSSPRFEKDKRKNEYSRAGEGRPS